MKSWLPALALAAGLAGPAVAAPAQALGADSAVEKRLMALAEDVRCLVCQNESLAGSRAELAQDLRREMRQLMKQGKSDAEVLEFLVSRYGDYVLYRPPLKASTAVLWAGPFVLLALGVLALLRSLREHRRAPSVGAHNEVS